VAARAPSSIFPRIEEETISVDTETTGLSWKKDKIFGFAVATTDQSWYFDVREVPNALAWLHATCAQPSIKRIVNHSVKFDWLFLHAAGCDLPLEKIECTIVRECLIDEHQRSYSLDSVAKRRVGRSKDVEIYGYLAGLFGGPPTRSAQIGNLHRAPSGKVATYAKPDAELALALWHWQEDEIARQDLSQIWQLERALTPVLIRMEQRGVRVDVKRTSATLDHVVGEIRKHQVYLDKTVGTKGFNANSAPQVRKLYKPEPRDGEWFLGTIRLDKTDAGNPSIGADTLRLLDDPVSKAILKYRKLDKARQFLEGHILGHAIGDFVYPNYNQTRGDNELGTRTGRLSINDPALQQIPARDVEMGELVRSCFVPPPSLEWTSADWEQFEFRWFAHYADSEPINELYQQNPDADFHQLVASLTGLPRSPRFAGDANAKQINLGLVFGMGDGKLAAEMGLPYHVQRSEKWGKDILVPGPEAQDVFRRYHESIPGIQGLLRRASSIAKSRGYVKTGLGRHIRFPGGQFTHKAAGLVFQGTSADAMKLKLVELDAAGLDPNLSVHDEVDFYRQPGDDRKVSLIRDILENFNEGGRLVCRIPIKTKIKSAKNWWLASKG
jgi:DNA polymerase I-like protein with 3'-5' exonuclease and polymerase domains